MTDFADLELSLHRRDGDNYNVEMRFNQPNSQADIRLGTGKPVSVTFDLPTLRGMIADPFEYGKTLTESLFADANLASSLAQARANAQSLQAPLRIRLLIGPSAPELNTIYWEVLLDPQDESKSPLFMGENILFSRYLSSDNWTPVKLRAKGDLRALTAVSNPSNLQDYKLAEVDVPGELKRAREALDNISTAELGDKEKCTLNNIMNALRDGIDILYLATHGTVVNGEPRIWLEDDDGKAAITSAEALVAQIKELQQQPRLIVLASCQSAGKGIGDVLQALGPKLAQAGVPAVIAMQGNISMESIKKFMPIFFAEVQKDGQIDRALAVARGSIRHEQDYWMPVLFMRLKNGRIWDVPGIAEESKQSVTSKAARNYKSSRALDGLFDSERFKDVSPSQDCLLCLTEKRLFPQELVHEFPYSVVTGEIGSGKSWLMQHLAYENLTQTETRYWLWPISFRTIRKDILVQADPLDGLRELLGEDSEIFFNNWNEGTLWLYVDDIDSQDENFPDFEIWINKLRQMDEESAPCNRIWLNLRTQDYLNYMESSSFWKELPLAQPTAPEIWQYLESWRQPLKEKWGDFYNYWMSQLSPPEKQSLLVISLTLKSFKEHSSPNPCIEILRTLTYGYLKRLLPAKIRQNAIMVNEADHLMISTVSHLWNSLPTQQWSEWDGKVRADYFIQARSNVQFQEVGTALVQALLIRDGSHYTLKYIWMLKYWLVQSFMEIWAEKHTDSEQDELAAKLVMLLDNQAYADVPVYCLNTLTDSASWHLVFSKIQSYLSAIKTDKQAERAVKYLWLIFRQANPILQNEVLVSLIELLNRFPELEKLSIWERDWALDTLAMQNRTIPPAIEQRLSEHLIRRHSMIKNLVHDQQSSRLYQYHEWLNILEHYPMEWAVSLAIKDCIINKFDNEIAERILTKFSYFLESPQVEQLIIKWEENITSNPQVIYITKPQRTILLLKALQHRKKLNAVSFIKNMYNLAEQKQDNKLKGTLLEMLQPADLLGQQEWLLELFAIEKDREVKGKILDCLIHSGNTPQLEKLLSKRLDKHLQVRIFNALLEHHYGTQNKEDETSVLEQLFRNKPVETLDVLTRLPGLRPAISRKIVIFYLDSKTWISRKEEVLLSQICRDPEIKEKIMKKLPSH